MCSDNSDQRICGKALEVIVGGAGHATRVPWCAQTDRAIYQLASYFQLNPSNITSKSVQDPSGRADFVSVFIYLCRLLQLDHPAHPQFNLAVHPKLKLHVDALLRDLHKRHIIVIYNLDGASKKACYWPPHTARWAEPSWDGGVYGEVVPLHLREALARVHLGDDVPAVVLSAQDRGGHVASQSSADRGALPPPATWSVEVEPPSGPSEEMDLDGDDDVDVERDGRSLCSASSDVWYGSAAYHGGAPAFVNVPPSLTPSSAFVTPDPEPLDTAAAAAAAAAAAVSTFGSPLPAAAGQPPSSAFSLPGYPPPARGYPDPAPDPPDYHQSGFPPPPSTGFSTGIAGGGLGGGVQYPSFQHSPSPAPRLSKGARRRQNRQAEIQDLRDKIEDLMVNQQWQQPQPQPQPQPQLQLPHHLPTGLLPPENLRVHSTPHPPCLWPSTAAHPPAVRSGEVQDLIRRKQDEIRMLEQQSQRAEVDPRALTGVGARGPVLGMPAYGPESQWQLQLQLQLQNQLQQNQQLASLTPISASRSIGSSRMVLASHSGALSPSVSSTMPAVSRPPMAQMSNPNKARIWALKHEVDELQRLERRW